MTKQIRTDAVRLSDTKRQQRHRNKGGRAGPKTEKAQAFSDNILAQFIEARSNGGYNLVDPAVLVDIHKLTETQASMVNVRLNQASRHLTYKQIAIIVGCHEATVCRFLDTAEYYKVKKSVDVYEPRVSRIEDKALDALEENVEQKDSHSIDTALKLSGRLNQAETKPAIQIDQLNIHVHDSLKSLEPANAVEAEFTVEGEDE